MSEKRIIAVNSNCYHGYSIEEAISGIQKAGFHYIELTATKGWTEHVFPDMTFERLLKIKEELNKADLIPFSMSGHCNLMDTERLQDFVKNIELAAFFGCDYIVTSIGEAHLKDRETTGCTSVAENICSLLPFLEKHKMTLVLETHGKDHGKGTQIAEIVRLVGSERVKINFDTANVIFYGRVDPVENLKECLEDVAYLHLKDKGGADDTWDFPALGKGRVDFPSIFDLLNKTNNNSPFSIEIEFTQAGPKNLQEVDQAVLDSAEYLRKQGFIL